MEEREIKYTYIENYVCTEDTQVAPVMRVEDIERRPKELVSGS